MKYKDVDFLSAYYRKPIKIQTEKSFGTAFIFPVLLAVALGGVFAYYKYSYEAVKSDRDKAQSYISDSSNIAAAEKYTKLLDEIAVSSQTVDQINKALSTDGKSSKITYGELAAISACADGTSYISSLTFDKTASAISIKVRSSSETEIPAFIKRLKATGKFTAVVYSGYNFIPDAKVFELTAICTLS